MPECWKIGYANRLTAEDACALQNAMTREIATNAKDRRKVLYPYRCNRCNKFHLTKQRPRSENH